MYMYFELLNPNVKILVYSMFIIYSKNNLVE